MKPALKKAWVKALRSGEYEQGRNCLCDAGKEWCCLGVLCNLPGVPGEWSGDAYSFGGKYDSHYLPGPLAPEIGLSKARQAKLAAMNDNFGANFDAIADWIEKNL